jgi:Flp pilus assembly pilin Flp
MFRVKRKFEGQGLVEYGMILTLIAVAAIAALVTLGGSITSSITSSAGSLFS